MEQNKSKKEIKYIYMYVLCVFVSVRNCEGGGKREIIDKEPGGAVGGDGWHVRTGRRKVGKH